MKTWMTHRPLVLVFAIGLLQLGCQPAPMQAQLLEGAQLKSKSSQSGAGSSEAASAVASSSQGPCADLDASIVSLSDGSVRLTGNAVIGGNVYMGAASRLHMSGNAKVEGSLLRAAQVRMKLSGNSTIVGGVADMSSDQSELAQKLSDDMAALAATSHLDRIKGSQVISGSGGLNVIEIRNNVHLSGGDALILSGQSSDRFVFNIHGGLHLSGQSQVILDGGVLAENVLFNLIDTGSPIQLSGNVRVSGTLLGIERGVQISGNGQLRGALIARQGIQISGNGFVLDEASFCGSTGGGGNDGSDDDSGDGDEGTGTDPDAGTGTETGSGVGTDGGSTGGSTDPTPTPVPTPVPAPDEDPAPSPTPVPEPVPAPTPAPTPVPAPDEDPAPSPTPAPEPIPEPTVVTISRWMIVERSATTIEVFWETNVPASSEVLIINTNTQAMRSVKSATLKTSHFMTIDGLTSQTLYQLQAISTSSDGGVGRSAIIQQMTD